MISQDRYINIITQTITSTVNPNRDLMTRIITDNERLQSQSIIEFTDASTVGSYFGNDSEEYKRAAVYFNFASKSGRRPNKLSFYRWQKNSTGLAIYGDTAEKTLATIVGQANSYLALAYLNEEKGQKTSLGVVDLSDFSTTPPATLADVAAALQKDISTLVKNTTNIAVTFNALTNQFVLTADYSSTDDGSQLIVDQDVTQSGFNIAQAIGWGTPNCVYATAQSGKTIDAAVEESENLSNNFGSFCVAGADLSVDQIQAVSTWNAGRNNRYMYLVAVTLNNFETVSQAVKSNGGTALTLRSLTLVNDYIEMLPGMILASTDYTQSGAVKNYMYYQSSSFNPSVNNDELANRLDASLINYYGQTQDAGQSLAFYQRGVLCGGSGDVVDMTTYANELWLKGDITTRLFNLFLNREALTDDPAGISIIQAIIQKSIDQAKTNGTISIGVELNADEQITVNSITNNNKSAVNQIQSSGYWLDVQIKDKKNDSSGLMEKCAVYTLIYTKADQIRTVQGTHNLV